MRKIGPLDEVLPLFLTKEQITQIKEMTACGYSQKSAIRRLINLGLERETGQQRRIKRRPEQFR